MVVVVGQLKITSFSAIPTAIQVMDTDEWIWMSSNEIPYSYLVYTPMVRTGRHELLFFGMPDPNDDTPEHPTQLIKLMCFNLECKWITIPFTNVSSYRFAPLTMLVPENLVSCEQQSSDHITIQCSYENKMFMSNGECDTAANTTGCFFDGGDCVNMTQPDRECTQLKL